MIPFARLLTQDRATGAPPGPPDGHWGDVNLLLEASRGIVDCSTASRAMTAQGTVSVANTGGVFGGKAFQFHGSPDGILTPGTADLNAEPSAFTAECFFKLTARNDNQAIMGLWAPSNLLAESCWYMFVQSGTYRVLIANNGLGYRYLDSGITPALNAWHHAAFGHNGSGDVRLFLNGHQVAAEANGCVYQGPSNFTVGTIGGAEAAAAYDMVGLVDQVRVTNGFSRYTGGDYTVPTAPFPTHG